MGDVIHTLPAVHFLRRSFPHAYIGWLIEERWAELLCAAGSPRRGARSALRPLVDEVHTVKLKDWRKSPLSISTAQGVATVWNDVRGAKYDVVVDLQGAIRSAVLARLSGARVVYGAAEPRESPASLWYTREVVGHGRHVIEQNLSIAAGLVGASMEFSPSDVSCDLPLDIQAEGRVEQRLAELGVGEFAILNPGTDGERSSGRRSGMVRWRAYWRRWACVRFLIMVRAKRNSCERLRLPAVEVPWR